MECIKITRFARPCCLGSIWVYELLLYYISALYHRTIYTKRSSLVMALLMLNRWAQAITLYYLYSSATTEFWSFFSTISLSLISAVAFETNSGSKIRIECVIVFIFSLYTSSRSDGQVVNETDSSVSGASSSPAWMHVFSTVQGDCTSPLSMMPLLDRLSSSSLSSIG